MTDWKFPYGKLSPREDELFARIARGQTLRDIAHAWSVAFTTVRTVYARACTKLGARTQGHAMARWKDHQHARALPLIRPVCDGRPALAWVPERACRSPRLAVVCLPMTAIATELDAKMQSIDADTARRLERLVRDAMELAQPALGDVGMASQASEEAVRRARLFAAMDKVKAFSAADRLSRDEVHAR